VTDERGGAIAGANVIIRKGRLQHSTNTNAAGEYVFTGVATGVWTATVSAPGSYFTETAQVTVDAERPATLDIVLRGPRPLPVTDGFSLSNGTRSVVTNEDGVPVVYWNQPITINLENDKYANGRLSWQFILNGKAVASGEDVPDSPAGTGRYSVTINPSGSWPTGQATFIYSIKLKDVETPIKGDFDLYYIDPSGVVVDKYGRPIEGAKVTLYRKDESGAFTAVPDGSSVMDPSNRSNPSTTLSDGVFHWDVIDGTYKVTATFGGKSVSTPEMEISPARTGLVLKLDVSAGGAEAPEPKTYPKVSGALKAGKTIKISGVKWGDEIKQKSYDWYVGGKLQKSHGATLKLTKAMLKKKIVCYAVGERSVLGNPDGIEQKDGSKQTHVFKIRAQVYPFAVTFDANGGKELSKAKNLKSGLTLGAKAGKLPKATRPGYLFNGWRTGVAKGAKVSAKTKIARTSVFYAQWKLKKGYVQINVDVNGGAALSPAEAAKAVKKSAKVGTLPTPKRANYKFLGWFSAKHGGKKITAKTKLTKSATFYAHWQMA
jgi:uncharacterized repeat protein (TIGR02543 family)